MGERLSPILGGVHGRIRRYELLLPPFGRALAVMAVQRLLVVGVRIAEQLPDPRTPRETARRRRWTPRSADRSSSAPPRGGSVPAACGTARPSRPATAR